MDKKSIYLGIEGNEHITILQGIENIAAKIFFKPDKITRIEVSHYTDYSKIKINDSLIKFSYKGTIYTGKIYQYDHGTFHIDLILQGGFEHLNDIKFHKFELYLANLNPYLISMHSDFKFNDTGYERKINYHSFSAIIVFKKKKITISSDYRVNTKKDGRNLIIDEYPIISIKCPDKLLDITEIQGLIYELTMLFSFLMGKATSPNYIWGISNIRSSIYYSIPTIENVEELEYPHYALINPEILSKENLFNQTIKTFFSNDINNKINIIFSRFYSLLSTKNMWEYEILGLTSVFERYLKEIIDYSLKESSISKKNINSVKKAILKIIKNNFDQTISSKLISHLDKEEINIPTSKRTNFFDKYEKWISEISIEFKKIFNFNEDEFRLIKKIRDNVAHADSIDFNENNINEIFTIKNKLNLILYYLVYQLLGIPEKIILVSFKTTLNSIVRSSNINRTELDRASGNVVFLPVSDSTFNAVKKVQNNYIIIEKHQNKNEYIFNAELTKLIATDIEPIWGGFRDLKDYVRKLYNNEDLDVDFKSGYVETSNKKTINVHGMCIVNFDI